MQPAFERHRFTAEEVLRMVEHGILDEHAPLELIDGDLIEMAPQGPIHRGLTVRIRELLTRAFGEGHHVQDHSPVLAGPHSLPEPDVAVVRGPIRFDAHPGPAEVALVVEIAHTSHAADRAKAAVYAGAGFTEYWLVDVPARCLTTHRAPDRAHRAYTELAIRREGDTVRAGSVDIPVDALLPPM